MQIAASELNAILILNHFWEDCGDVTIYVYKVLGELTAELSDEFHSAGKYEVTWNAAAHASGIYFVQIKSNAADGSRSFTKTVKMILMK